MRMRIALVPLLFFALACGNAAVIAPQPLTVVDTAPGNGSLVPAGETTIAVLFSADIDPSTLPTALALEQVTPGGTPIQGEKTTLQNYANDTFTATYSVDPLPSQSAFRMTVKHAVVRATSGATLRTDLVRNFATTL
jgi:hypothetical protein